jgi:hypothetical protein
MTMKIFPCINRNKVREMIQLNTERTLDTVCLYVFSFILSMSVWLAFYIYGLIQNIIIIIIIIIIINSDFTYECLSVTLYYRLNNDNNFLCEAMLTIQMVYKDQCDI